MVLNFEKEYLRELYEKGKSSDKKHRFQPEIIRAYAKCVCVCVTVKRSYHPRRVIQIPIIAL